MQTIKFKVIGTHDGRDTVDVVLPKQWKHWCSVNGLRRHSRKVNKWDRKKDAWMYLKGRGFVWRINCFGEFQRGDSHDEFDRWALCIIDSANIPTSLAQFTETVNRLINDYGPR